MKPHVFKKAKDAIRKSRHLVSIDASLSANGVGFMPVTEGYLIAEDGELWLPSVDFHNKKLTLVPHADA